MSKHPVNLVLRFILEVAALVVFALWGWHAASGWLAIVLVIGLPLISATAWGVFAVKDDPSRSGDTVVPTKGIVRLLLELLFFGMATFAFYDLGYNNASSAMAILVVVHYIFSYDRIVWLLKR